MHLGTQTVLLAAVTLVTITRDARAETLGVDCNVDEKVNSGDKKVITYNGTALSPSCRPMTFRAAAQLMLCVQSSQFRDPDCAVELRFTNRKNGEVKIFNCRESSAFCIKPNGTLEIQISARDGKSPRNAVLRLDLFTKNSTHTKDKDEIDYELIATLTRVLIPLSLFMIFGIIFAICFYKQRKKAHAQYLGKSGTGSGSNAEGFFGSPALENYPAPPPQAQQTSAFGVYS
uniref:Uncharacterized protein LOC111107497 n=1 Tax=Crassostrea virginica TaxID=6565 RepID=A0A8B8B5Q3_CRAVI|nr:uncharacterized protein LOC111107497 [Crassostrea virginica]